MAWLQLGAGLGIQLSNIEKSVTGEAATEALNFLAKNDNEDAKLKQLTTVAGDVRNVQGRPLKLEKSREWFGHYVCPPPATIGGCDHGAFAHRANPINPDVPHAGQPSVLGSKTVVIYGAYGKSLPPAGPPSVLGSKAVVIYGTYDKSLPQLGYLLAWYKSENTSEHKVYVEAGELSKLVKLEWCEIERKLDKSHSKSRYVDKATGATAVAEITNKSGNVASLGVCFNQLVGNAKA